MSLRTKLITSCNLRTSPQSCVAQFLVPFLTQPSQRRNASILASLSDNPGAYNKKIRRGRGPSSGKGKTSGRGHKGQKQHGKVPAGFNGGQTPDEVVHGHRGFDNQFSIDLAPLNVDRLQSWIDQGRIDPSKPITMKELHESRCLHGVKDGVKLLARNAHELRTPVNIVVSRASAAAIDAVEKAGGRITTRFYAPSSIQRVLRGLIDPVVSLMMRDSPVPDGGQHLTEGYKYRLPDPTSRKDIEYYRDPAHRGYLSYMIGEGEGPSLFFKPPGSENGKPKVSRKSKANSAKSLNKLW